MEERMKKILSIDNYKNGISETDFYCTEIVLAVVCGYYKYEFYFYYLLLKIIDSNWEAKGNINIFEFLGLTFNFVELSSDDDLIKFIDIQMGKKEPVIIPVNYNALFFFEDYEKRDDIHFMLINGINKDNGVIYTRLSQHLYTDPINNNIGLYTLRLKKEMIFEIWHNSNESKLIDDVGLKNKLIVIKQKESKNINSLYKVISFILNNYIFNISIFSKKITEIGKKSSKEFRSAIWDLKVSHVRYIDSFFSLIIKLLDKEKSCLQMIKDIEDERSKNIKTRNFIIDEIQIKKYRNEPINFQNYISIVSELDLKFEKLLHKIKNELELFEDAYNSNIIELCSVSVSSEDEVYFSPVNVLFDNEEIWRSESCEGFHWIKFGIPVNYYVKKVVINHDTNYNKLTKVFLLEGSMDDKVWNEIDYVNNNDKVITTHYIDDTKWRYIRIKILEAGRYTRQARIRMVQLFGYSIT